MPRAVSYIMLLATLVAAACSPAQETADTAAVVSDTSTTPRTIDDIDFDSYSAELAAYTDLRVGQSRIGAIDVVRLLFAPTDGSKIIKTGSAEFEMEGGGVLLLSASGLADDSVHAQEFYLIFEGEGAEDKMTQKLAAYGLRVKCVRPSNTSSNNTSDWQKQPCP